MLDRKHQIVSLIQKFHALRQKVSKGKYLISARNQIPNSQWIVLYMVYHNEGIGIKELAKLLGISSSATTQLVDNLVKRGFLIRKISTEDRRALKIGLSRKTKNLIEAHDFKSFGKATELFDVLTDEEFEIYYKLTNKIVDKIINSEEW